MSIFNFVGSTIINQNFLTGSVFISSKIVIDFVFAFQSLKAECDTLIYAYLKTFISDGNPQQLTTLRQVFPRAQFILCIWNVNSNIQVKLRPLIKQKFICDDDITNKEKSAKLTVFVKKNYYYYYYSSNLRAHGVCDYGTLPVM